MLKIFPTNSIGKRKARVEIQSNKKIICGLLCLLAQNYFGLRKHFSIGFGKDHQRELLQSTYYLKCLLHGAHCV